MSELRDMHVTTLLTPDGKLKDEDTVGVGDMVRYLYAPSTSSGVIVEIIDEITVKVLWSQFSNPWDGVIRPLGGVPYAQVAKQMFSVQPMPLPSALVFYLDECEKRLNEEEKKDEV